MGLVICGVRCGVATCGVTWGVVVCGTVMMWGLRGAVIWGATLTLIASVPFPNLFLGLTEAAGYLRMQSPTTPVAVPHFAAAGP